MSSADGGHEGGVRRRRQRGERGGGPVEGREEAHRQGIRSRKCRKFGPW